VTNGWEGEDRVANDGINPSMNKNAVAYLYVQDLLLL
jgi:hypothetical protein